MIWSERIIGRAVSRQLFKSSAIVMVPNCNWTGHECDILVVEKNLRIIDIEVKISRADLKADAKKDKWWQRFGYHWDDRAKPPVARAHPPKVWKHYYALPKDIWLPELAACIPAASGILLLSPPRDSSSVLGPLVIHVERMAKPCRDADKLSPTSVLDIARLASFRMWESYAELEALKRSRELAAAA